MTVIYRYITGKALWPWKCLHRFYAYCLPKRMKCFSLKQSSEQAPIGLSGRGYLRRNACSKTAWRKQHKLFTQDSWHTSLNWDENDQSRPYLGMRGVREMLSICPSGSWISKVGRKMKGIMQPVPSIQSDVVLSPALPTAWFEQRQQPIIVSQLVLGLAHWKWYP